MQEKKLIPTPIQQMSFTFSFKNKRAIIIVNTGDDVIMKLLTPDITVTEPVLNK